MTKETNWPLSKCNNTLTPQTSIKTRNDPNHKWYPHALGSYATLRAGPSDTWSWRLRLHDPWRPIVSVFFYLIWECLSIVSLSKRSKTFFQIRKTPRSQALTSQGPRKGEEEHTHRHTLKAYVEKDQTGYDTKSSWAVMASMSSRKAMSASSSWW